MFDIGPRSGLQLSLRSALPNISEKAQPVLDPTTSVLAAVSLLAFHEIDAIPLAFQTGTWDRVVSGYSSLARFMVLGPESFRSFLEKPCEDASEEFLSVSVDCAVEHVLETFMKGRLALARVDDREGTVGVVSLNDILGLYRDGAVRSELRARDVASPIFSMPPSASIRLALRAMLRGGYRRVFISDRAFISDRSIIANVFRPAGLNAMTSGGRDTFEAPLGKLEASDAETISPDATMDAAASALMSRRGLALVCDRGVVTPWDVVMKPWALTFSRRGRRKR